MIKKFKPFEAPERFVFRDPDTGHLFSALNREMLLSHIVSYRQQNGLEPIEALGHVVENYLCEQPKNFGKCKEVGLAKGFLYYLKGGVKLIKQMFYGSYVSQEEADRRADICVNCPNNQPVDKGEYLHWANKVAIHTIGGRRSRHFDKLYNCSVCDCLMRSKVWYGGSIELPKDQIEEMRKVNCWQPEVAEKR